jgi:hypothetical protein
MLGVGSLVGVPIAERIPESSKLAGNEVPIQSVVVNRKQVKQVPSNGSAFGANQVVNFVLSSGQDFMIPSTACLHYKIENTSTGGATDSCIDDLATAVWNRGTLALSGVQLEQTLDLNKAVNTLVYAHMNSAHYEREATINAKAWKWAKGLYSSQAGTAQSASATYVQAEATQAIEASNAERLDATGVARRQNERAVEEQAGTVEVNIPLSYIFALFRSNKLFPLSFVSDLRIELNTESAIKALFSPSDTATVNYEIQDVYITYDAVSLSSDYLRVLTASFSAGADMGYTLPVNVITTSQSSTSATGEVDIVFSKSTPFLKAVYFRQQPTAFDTNENDYSISGQSYCLNTDPVVQLRIGTQPFPEYAPLHSAEEIYRNNQIHLSHYSNVLDNLGLAQHKNNWAVPVSASGDNSVFYMLFGFEKLAGLGADYYAMDSYDASVAGGVMSLHCSLASANVQTLAIFEHTRLVQFGDRRVDVRA